MAERRTDAELLTLGLDVAVRLRDGDNRDELRAALRSLRVWELRDLVVCLAACIDPDVSMRDLLAWCGGSVPEDSVKVGRLLKPCGTEAAYQRHRTRGERCDVCWPAMTKVWSARKAEYLARRKGAA